ncbi:MAG TPA: thiosulfate oxidation carrier complex protein SoxZ [Burkholderiales bacterium]|nr:thiosulfate oxidation carrier complex protein SoxZ [Burkholderiales bacterium]
MAEPMKIRATLQGDVVEVKVLISHPMETGQRKDPESGATVPLHFIQKVTATLNDTPVMEAQWSQAISKNPFLGFKIRGAKAGDRLAVAWSDNKGQQGSIETTVTGGT